MYSLIGVSEQIQAYLGFSRVDCLLERVMENFLRGPLLMWFSPHVVNLSNRDVQGAQGNIKHGCSDMHEGPTLRCRVSESCMVREASSSGMEGTRDGSICPPGKVGYT